MQYWLFKTEPGSYSWDDLLEDGVAEWDGVRNYTARNYLRAQVKVGDLVLFYHSNANPSGVIAVARVVRDGYPDNTAWELDSDHPDPRSTPDKPLWYMVDIEPVRALTEPLSLQAIKAIPDLADMVLVKNARLSVQPVTRTEFEMIVALGGIDI
jgi:predicted RNA-binding protein with PUA-like domain